MTRLRLRSLATGVLFVIGLGIFGYFASAVESLPGEVSSLTWVQSWRTSWLDTAMKAVSVLGTLPVAAPVVLVLAMGIYALGWRAEAVLLLATTAAGRLVAMGLKDVIARPRPSEDFVQVLQETSSYSFPSGHAMHYAVLFGIVLVVLNSRTGSGALLRITAVAFTALLVVMGLSRIYLGMHWLWDVVGGYVFGAGVVIVATWVWGCWPAPHDTKNK